MRILLLVGAVIGLILGLAHARLVYFRRLQDGSETRHAGPLAMHGRALYFAVWTLVLWALAGTYVLCLWLVSLIVYAVSGTRWKLPAISYIR